MAEIKFLRGKFTKVWDYNIQLWTNTRDTLIAVDDIKRVRACKIHVYDPAVKKEVSVHTGLTVSAICRLETDDNVTVYELTDDMSIIAEAIGRSEEELNAMLLELEVKD